MNKLIILLLSLISTATHAEIHVQYDTGVAIQKTEGAKPNDTLTAFIKPNVGITSESDMPGIYSVVGVDIQCQGSTIVQKQGEKSGTVQSRYYLNVTDFAVIGYNDWAETEKSCVMIWTAESIATKTSSGTSISFSVGGDGASLSISTSSELEPPDNKKGRTRTTEFKMHKETPMSPGSTC
jgi:hypothetical protein